MKQLHATGCVNYFLGATEKIWAKSILGRKGIEPVEMQMQHSRWSWNQRLVSQGVAIGRCGLFSPLSGLAYRLQATSKCAECATTIKVNMFDTEIYKAVRLRVPSKTSVALLATASCWSNGPAKPSQALNFVMLTTYTQALPTKENAEYKESKRRTKKYKHKKGATSASNQQALKTVNT